MIIKCASNCEHPYLFQHSIVTTERIVKAPDGSRINIVTTTLICRECGHWTNSNPGCPCAYRCHEEVGVWLFLEDASVVLWG
jgi:hypothetical protein